MLLRSTFTVIAHDILMFDQKELWRIGILTPCQPSPTVLACLVLLSGWHGAVPSGISSKSLWRFPSLILQAWASRRLLNLLSVSDVLLGSQARVNRLKSVAARSKLRIRRFIVVFDDLQLHPFMNHTMALWTMVHGALREHVGQYNAVLALTGNSHMMVKRHSAANKRLSIFDEWSTSASVISCSKSFLFIFNWEQVLEWTSWFVARISKSQWDTCLPLIVPNRDN